VNGGESVSEISKVIDGYYVEGVESKKSCACGGQVSTMYRDSGAGNMH
jgi:hypothetical protein